jgi:hypothetical protein
MLLFEQPGVSTAAEKQTRLVSTPTKWKPLTTVLSPSTSPFRLHSDAFCAGRPTARITVPVRAGPSAVDLGAGRQLVLRIDQVRRRVQEEYATAL